MLPPDFDGYDTTRSCNFYSLTENKVLTVTGGGESDPVPNGDLRFKGSSHGWLAPFNWRDLDLFLYNPLSSRHVKLPPVHTLPDIPEVNLRGGYGCIIKLIISCSSDEENCRAMVIYNTNDALVFCCPGRSDRWTPIGQRFEWDEDIGQIFARSYVHFVYSPGQNLFFCITNGDDLEAWDLCDPSSPRMIMVKKIDDDNDEEEE